jgi:hypothetical protein
VLPENQPAHNLTLLYYERLEMPDASAKAASKETIGRETTNKPGPLEELIHKHAQHHRA